MGLKDYLKESYGSGKMKTIKKGSDVFMENYTLQCSTKDMKLTKDNANKVIELTRFNVSKIIFKYTNYRKLMQKMLLI